MKELLTGLQHIGVPTRDFNASRAFYEKLGFEAAYETVQDGAQVVFLQLGNLCMEVYEASEDEVAGCYGGLDHVAIDVTDVQKVYEKICAMGMNNMNDTIHDLPYWENGVQYFKIEGPNKEVIEFSQYL